MPHTATTLAPATRNHLGYLDSVGTDGSMPGPDALTRLAEMQAAGVPVHIVCDGPRIIGAVALAELPGGQRTTVTYVRPGCHTPELSTTLKESARQACIDAGHSYVILVSPDNEPAKASMARVWPDAETQHAADGTLVYSTRQPVTAAVPSIVATFAAALR